MFPFCNPRRCLILAVHNAQNLSLMANKEYGSLKYEKTTSVLKMCLVAILGISFLMVFLVVSHYESDLSSFWEATYSNMTQFAKAAGTLSNSLADLNTSLNFIKNVARAKRIVKQNEIKQHSPQQNEHQEVNVVSDPSTLVPMTKMTLLDHSSLAPKRCEEGIDTLPREKQFWKYNNVITPGLNDVFERNGTVHFVFLIRDRPSNLVFHFNNSDSRWVCSFNECESVKGDSRRDGTEWYTHGANAWNLGQEDVVQLVSCRIPQRCLALWRAVDPDNEQAQNVTLSARSKTGMPFGYEQVQFCRYPDPDEWAPAVRARNLWSARPRDEDGSPPLELAACTMFKSGIDRNRDLIVEWIAYHTLQGMQHFYLFVNEESSAVRILLKPHIDSGLVSVVEWLWGNTSVNVWAYQLTALNSCVQRYRGLSRYPCEALTTQIF